MFITKKIKSLARIFRFSLGLSLGLVFFLTPAHADDIAALDNAIEDFVDTRQELIIRTVCEFDGPTRPKTFRDFFTQNPSATKNIYQDCLDDLSSFWSHR